MKKQKIEVNNSEITTTLDVSEEKGKQKKEKDSSGNAVTRFVKKSIKWLVIVLVIFLLVSAGGLFWYVGHSSGRVDVDVETSLDADTYMRGLIERDMYGNHIETRIEEDVINWFIQQNIGRVKEMTLPMETKVNDILYSCEERSLFVFLQGSYIDTYLKVEVGVDVDDDTLTTEIRSIKLGKWSLPLPTGLIFKLADLPDAYYDGFEIPEVIVVDDIDLNRKDIEIVADLNDEYLSSLIELLEDGINMEMASSYYEFFSGDSQEIMDLYWSVVMDQNQSDRKELLSLMIRSKANSVLLLAIQEEEVAYELVRKLERDIDYLPDDFASNMMDARQKFIDKYAE